MSFPRYAPLAWLSRDAGRALPLVTLSSKAIDVPVSQYWTSDPCETLICHTSGVLQGYTQVLRARCHA